MLDSLWRTTKGYDVEVVVVVDDDIISANVALMQQCHIVEHSRVRRGALYCWNRGLQLCSGDLIVPAGDDQVFHEDWLKYALESHQERLGGSGVVGMNDLAYDGNKQLATMFMFDRQFCKEVMGGIFAPPCYIYLNVDSEWNEKAKMLNKFYWDSRSVVEHLHSAHGKRVFDDHDKEKLEKNLSEIDGATFEDRKSRGFPIEWSSII